MSAFYSRANSVYRRSTPGFQVSTDEKVATCRTAPDADWLADALTITGTIGVKFHGSLEGIL
jgi:hypothetical protein